MLLLAYAFFFCKRTYFVWNLYIVWETTLKYFAKYILLCPTEESHRGLESHVNDDRIVIFG